MGLFEYAGAVEIFPPCENNKGPTYFKRPLYAMCPRTDYKPQERVYHPPFPYDLKSHILVLGALWISYLYPYSKEHTVMFLCFYAARVFLSPEPIHYFEKILPCIKAVTESTRRCPTICRHYLSPVVPSYRRTVVCNSFGLKWRSVNLSKT